MLPFDFGSIAVDTNVFIYALDSDLTNPKVAIARGILRRADHFPIRVPLQAIAESFSVLTRRYHWTGRSALDALTPFLALPSFANTIVSTSTAMALCAEHNVAFWDAMIVSGAAASGCGAILTEDCQNLRRFDPPDVARRIHIVNPFDHENLPILHAIGAVD